MPSHQHSAQHQQPHHRQQQCARRHHRRERKVPQVIEISKDTATSKIQVSITSQGPIDTKVVLNPSVFGLSTATDSSPWSPSSPLRTLSTTDTHIPLNPPLIDLPSPPPSLRDLLLNMGM
ncbi:unnamed protein product [Rotaria sp. Silwood1]|nr:unnamed protein product [Rotaria sp. Silwood1]CAF5008831.1 unnamed protein product [Rotaria sp. Silwood1]